MRSPGSSFDLRAALIVEVQAALEQLAAEPLAPKRVHGARVRLKRARALARVGAVGAPGLSEVFNSSARACMRSLAPARDAAALADAARDAARGAKKKARHALIDIAENQDQITRDMPPPDLDRVRTGLKDLLALAQVWPDASPRQISRGVLHVKRRAKHARRRAIGETAPELRHTWRRREKERLYVIDILGQAWPGRRRHKTSDRLGRILGRERDVGLLAEHLKHGILANDRTAHVTRALKQRARQHRARADKLGRKLGKN